MAVAKVVGPLFSDHVHGQFAHAITFRDGLSVSAYTRPRNPRSPAQQSQRLRVAVMNEAARCIGPRWKGFWLDYLSDPSHPHWVAVLVQAGARRTGFVASRYAGWLVSIGDGGLVSWDTQASSAGVRTISVEGGGTASPGRVLLRLIATLNDVFGLEGYGELPPTSANAEWWASRLGS
jgi:hypothetical protein